MALELTILVGTMTGTANGRAEELELTLDDGENTRADRDYGRASMQGCFSGGGLFLICSSTYGQGDVSSTRRNLYSRPSDRASDLSTCIRRDRARRPDYAELSATGGKRFDAILSELGAGRIGGSWLHDASAAPCPRKSR